MKKEIKLMLVDDHEVVRKGIKSLIEKNEWITDILEASSGEEAIDIVSNNPPDLIISDMSMPGMSGIDLTIQIKENYPEIGVLILSMHNDEDYIMDALNAGAMGYLTKDAPPEEINSAINNLAQGKMYYSSSLTDILARQILRESKKDDLIKTAKVTVREIEVLKLIVEGFSNKEIAGKLIVSKRTVDNHRFNLMKKIGAKNTADIVRISFVNNLVSYKAGSNSIFYPNEQT